MPGLYSPFPYLRRFRITQIGGGGAKPKSGRRNTETFRKKTQNLLPKIQIMDAFLEEHPPPAAALEDPELAFNWIPPSHPNLDAPTRAVVIAWADEVLQHYGWTGHKPGSGLSDLAPSILHYNWF